MDEQHTTGVPYGYCQCGCGRKAKLDKSGTPRRYLRGHNRLRHGYSHRVDQPETPTYKSWSGMIRRCTNPATERYPRYGGRGITVCERWLTFENFLADMGERPEWATGGIDRIDNDGNYEPGNCRWATQAEQRRPKTHCKRGHEFTPENTRINSQGNRICRKCDAIREARRLGG